MTPVPLSMLLAQARDPAAIVGETGGRARTFAELRGDVAAHATRLRASNCRRGLLVTHDAYWAAVGLLALLHAGATVVLPQNLQPGGYGTDDWDRIVTDRASDSEGAYLLESAEKSAGPLPPLAESGGGFELFTAGSTGAPKRTTKSLAQMDAEAALVERLLAPWVDAVAPVLGTVPLHHLYGLTFRLVWPLTSGRLIGGRTHDFWESLATGSLAGAALITSPAHLTRISLPVLAADKGPALVLSAGAALPEAAAAAARGQLGTAVTEIFGSTETGVVAWRRRSEPDPAWTAFPGVEVKAQPDGRIAIQSPLIAASDLDSDGWYAGADLIALDGSGFRLQGRADRILKIEGKRVSLADLERRLGEHELVAEAAVLSLEEDHSVLGAVVVPTVAGESRLRELGAFRFGRLLRGQLSLTQDVGGLPRRWRFVAALPLAPLGKRRLADLRRLFDTAAETSAPPRPREPELRASRQIPDGIELDLFISPDLAQLEGHFPGLPIVPGVAQIDWAALFAVRHLQLPVEAVRRFQVKFRRVMTANVLVTLALRHPPATRRLEFSYRLGEEVLTSGTITLPEAP